jgi:hypothetical protein
MINYLDESTIVPGITIQPIPVQTDYVVNEWQPTMNLRWYCKLDDSKHVYNPVYNSIPKPIFYPVDKVKILQQKWISNTGKEEWRDIELINE